MADKHDQTQVSEKAADGIGHPTEERNDISSANAIHPVIAALEKADASTVVLNGFLGTSKGAVVRLYHALDTSDYVEIPREAVIYMEPDKHGEPGAFRAFIRASSEILSVRRRRFRAADFTGMFTAIPQPELPPLQDLDAPFYQCVAMKEETFKRKMESINDNLSLTDMIRQSRRLAAIAQLHSDIAECVDRHGVPRRLIGGIERLIAYIVDKYPLQR